MTKVAQWRIDLAGKYMQNTIDLALACRTVGIPYWASCALIEKESHGRNSYGGDEGGALRKFPHTVDKSNFLAFYHHVVVLGDLNSNGVGPCQITYAGPHSFGKTGPREGGYFKQMPERGLEPWIPKDNMVFGLGIFWKNYQNTHSWISAGGLYNGGPKWKESDLAVAYGHNILDKVKKWHTLFKIKGPIDL